MMKVVKKGIILPLVLVLASVALILGAFFLLDKQKTASQNPTESASPSPANETTNWKTYTNTEVGYSIKYPEYFEVDTKSENAISIFREENVSNPKYGGPDKNYGMTIYSRTFGNKEYQSRPFQKTQVGMYSATRWTDNPNYMEDIWVNNPNGKNAARITISTFVEKPPFDKNDFEVFNQILSTFKFTDQSLNTTNWKTYTNNELGISFEHPSEWGSIEEGKDTDCWPGAPRPCLHILLTFPKVREDNILLGSGNISYINNVVGKGTHFGHVMGKAFLTGTPFEKFVKEYCATPDTERCETKTNQYGVLYTKSLETNYDTLEGLALYYFIYHPNHEFEGLTVSNERFLDTPFSSDSEKNLDQILSTFRFVE